MNAALNAYYIYTFSSFSENYNHQLNMLFLNYFSKLTASNKQN